MKSEMQTRKNLSLDRLSAFGAVARAGSIAGVTGGDPSRQALISRQIAELASHFEVELTRRSGRGLVLTAAGERLARLVHEFEAGLEDLRRSVKNEPVAYSVAASNTVLQWLVAPRMRNINTALPAVTWILRHESTERIEEKVMMGEVDFGLSLGPQPTGLLKGHYLGSLEYALFVPRSMVDGDSLDTLLGRVPLAIPVGGRLRGSLDGWAARKSLRLRVRVDVDSYLQSAELVVQGTHAAVLPLLARRMMTPEVHIVKLPAQVAQRRKLWLIWRDRLLNIRTEATSVVEALVRTLSEPDGRGTAAPWGMGALGVKQGRE